MRQPRDVDPRSVAEMDANWELRRVVPPRLRRLMNERGVNRRELTAASGVSPAALSRVLSGKRAISTELLVRFCLVLDVSPAWLLGMTDWHIVPPPSRRE